MKRIWEIVISIWAALSALGLLWYTVEEANNNLSWIGVCGLGSFAIFAIFLMVVCFGIALDNPHSNRL